MQRHLVGITDGSLFTGKVYDRYHELCLKLKSQPRTIRMISNYLTDLEMQGLISAQMSEKYIGSNTRLVKLEYISKEIKEIIKISWK